MTILGDDAHRFEEHKALVKMRFQTALDENVEPICLAAMYACDFALAASNNTAKISIDPHYLRPELFELLLLDKFNEIVDFANEVDMNINLFWRAALLGIAGRHEKFTLSYSNCFGDGTQPKHQRYLLGTPNQAVQTLYKSQLEVVHKRLPKYEFSSTVDIAKWHDLARLCVPTINQVHETHEQIAEAVNSYIENKKMRRMEHLRTAGSLAVAAGKMFLAGCP